MWDPDQAIRAELLPGETLRWTGRPALLRVLLANAYGILFMLFWEGMVLSGVVGTLTGRMANKAGQPVSAVIPAAMSLAGLFGLFRAARPVLASRRTICGVTNRRVLVVSQLRERRVQSVAGTAIGGVETSQRLDGSGTITVREIGKNGERLSLAGVPDVRSAAEAIERLRMDGRTTLGPANLLRGL